MRALLARMLFFAVVLLAPRLGAAEDADRTTPRRSMAGFLEAAHAGELDRAALYLDLRHFDAEKKKTEGPGLARDLVYVLDHHVPVEPEALPDIPEGEGARGTPVDFAKITLRDQTVVLQLERVRGRDNAQRWLISRGTVALVPELDKVYGPARWQDRMPGWLRSPAILGNEPWQWLGIGVIFLGAYVVGRLSGALALYAARAVARKTKTTDEDALLEAARRPLRVVLASLLFRYALEALDLTPTSSLVMQRLAYTSLVVGVAWLVIAIAHVTTELVEGRLSDGPASSQMASRGLRTQLAVLRRVGSVIVVFVASAVVLLQFEFVRNVGVSLLASAGVVSLVVGLSAQKTIGAMIAGVQLSLAQPVRIGDAVTIENEFGEIEEIHLTYVVVRIWDQRRLIVPIQRLLEQPFVNWTKLGTELLGTVVLKVDPTMPMAPLRDELDRIVTSSKAWDGRTKSLIVLDVSDASLTVRALVSAANADALWELRNEVREKLMAFVSTYENGKYLVHVRGAATPA